MKDFSSDAEKIINQRIDEMCGLSPEEREKVLNIWGLSSKPTTRERRLQLEAYCLFFKVNPDLVSLAPPPLIYEVMKLLVEEAGIKRYSSKDTVPLVRGLIDMGFDKTAARKRVAQITGRTFEAVKAAHYRSEQNPKP